MTKLCSKAWIFLFCFQNNILLTFIENIGFVNRFYKKNIRHFLINHNLPKVSRTWPTWSEWEYTYIRLLKWTLLYTHIYIQCVPCYYVGPLLELLRKLQTINVIHWSVSLTTTPGNYLNESWQYMNGITWQTGLLVNYTVPCYYVCHT